MNIIPMNMDDYYLIMGDYYLIMGDYIYIYICVLYNIYNIHMTYNYPMIMPILPVLTIILLRNAPLHLLGVCAEGGANASAHLFRTTSKRFPASAHDMACRGSASDSTGEAEVSNFHSAVLRSWQSGLGILNRSRYRTLIIFF